MTRALVLFAAGIAVGAALVLVGFVIGTATAAGPSRPAPVVLVPLSPAPGVAASSGSSAASGTPRRRLPSEYPDAGQGDPSPVPTVTPVPPPTEPSMAPPDHDMGVGASLVTGVASWYSVGDGIYAAAGPALRTPGWRGRLVRVCGKQSCIDVPLIDACQCYQGEPRERVIDLSRDAFRALGVPPSRGLVEVSVTW